MNKKCDICGCAMDAVHSWVGETVFGQNIECCEECKEYYGRGIGFGNPKVRPEHTVSGSKDVADECSALFLNAISDLMNAEHVAKRRYRRETGEKTGIFSACESKVFQNELRRQIHRAFVAGANMEIRRNNPRPKMSDEDKDAISGTVYYPEALEP